MKVDHHSGTAKEGLSHELSMKDVSYPIKVKHINACVHVYTEIKHPLHIK